MQPSTFALQGGLDQESPALMIAPGKVIAGVNHESVSAGYQRVQGYERFSGRPRPSEAETPQDRAVRRALIQPVPGDGPVRGVLWYAGKLHAWRDHNGVGRVNHSTPTGWTAPNMGTLLDFKTGTVEIFAGNTVTGATSGASGVVRSIVTKAETDWCRDAEGTMILDGVSGAFASGEVLNVSGGAAAIAAANSAPATFPAGGRYDFTVNNFYASTGFERAYGVSGVGRAFEYSGDSFIPIVTGMEDDRPFLIADHKSHLFLAFPKGSLQHSDLGEPRSFTARLGASELGLGHEITALVPNTADALLVMTKKTLAVLTGNDAADWLLGTMADDAGARPHTAQRIGQVIYLDERGIRSAQSTQTWGNFKVGTYTSLIQRELEEKRDAGIVPVASCVVKAKDQYLLFFSDGSGISIYFGRKNPEPMTFKLPFVVSCLTVAEVDGIERVFVGATDGYVYELNRGKSFDGAAINAFVQLAYSSQGAPRVTKRYHKLVLELTAAPDTTIAATADFDYAFSDQPFQHEAVFGIDGSGGLWGASEVLDLTWIAPTLAQGEAYADGSGSSISPIIFSSSADMDSYVLQAMTVLHTPRGMKR